MFVMPTFTERLNEAFEESGLDKTDLWRACGVSSGAVTHWLNGQTKKLTGDNLLKAARALKVNPEWLATGLGKKKNTNAITTAEPTNVKNVKAILNAVPKISWVQAGDLCDAEDHYEPGAADEWLICPVKHGKRTYVLEVVGDSMNSGDLDGYLEGFDIFVDPDIEPKHGDDVIVRTPDSKATFKRLQITEDGKYLLALNKTWPNRIIKVPEDTVICGVVIYSGKSRKK